VATYKKQRGLGVEAPLIEQYIVPAAQKSNCAVNLKKRGVMICVGCNQPPGPAGVLGLYVWL
jgi:hypothetical protein